MENIYITIITALAGGIGSWLTYKQGKKQSMADATQSAFKAYDFAIKSLREEFEAKYIRLQNQIETLNKMQCKNANCPNRIK